MAAQQDVFTSESNSVSSESHCLDLCALETSVYLNTILIVVVCYFNNKCDQLGAKNPIGSMTYLEFLTRYHRG
jgi:hypothetical protein